MDRALSSIGTRGSRRTIPQTPCFTQRDARGDRAGVSRGAPSPSVLGCKEVAHHRAAAAPTLGSSGALHGLRYLEPSRDGTEEAKPSAHRASGETREPTPGTERLLERRLQGPVQDG